MEDFEQIPKHKKKKQSNTSKVSKRSDHKHNYIDCILCYHLSFIDNERICYDLGSQCTICKKISHNYDHSKYSRFIIKDGCHYYVDSPSLLTRYPELPVITVGEGEDNI